MQGFMVRVYEDKLKKSNGCKSKEEEGGKKIQLQVLLAGADTFIPLFAAHSSWLLRVIDSAASEWMKAPL